MITMNIIKLGLAFDMPISDNFISTARLIISRLVAEYPVRVNYNLHYPHSSLDIYFDDPKQETMWLLRWS